MPAPKPWNVEEATDIARRGAALEGALLPVLHEIQARDFMGLPVE